ncbi:retrovirus-related Pol polyprotein from transposon 17.6 [Trichonephila clavipes]|nr:retrovirus-related Pol polyprotein from transposon 17.6 [Trichonephila clavipes]
MSKVVQNISDFACASIDDLAIFSDAWEEHLNHLEEVFKRLELFNFSVNLGKCEFARQKVKYLGHVIGSNRHSPDKERIKAMQNLQAPTTKKQLRSALGLCNFYRQVAGPRPRETVLLAYGCFSDGGRMLSRSIKWRRQHSSHSCWEPETEPKPIEVVNN